MESFYARYSGGGEREQFSQHADVCQELPPTATQFTALSTERWYVQDKARYNPTAEHFCRIEDAFEASIMSEYVLIDDVNLPDGCVKPLLKPLSMGKG